jgi:hypothetical protein
VSTNIFYCQDYFGILHSGAAEYLERLTANAKAATVLSSVPASSDTMELEGRQIKQCWIMYLKSPKNPTFKQWWIRDILVRIRNTELRIRFRILLFSAGTFKMSTKN